MKTKILSIAILIAGMTLFTTSCEKNEPKMDKENKEVKKLEVKEVKEKNISDHTKWYYFSFEKGEFVGEGSALPEVGDDKIWKARTDWDIAFHRQNVRTNGGTSGNGKSAVIKISNKKLSDIKEVPADSTFVVDEMSKVIVNTGHPFVYKPSSINPVADKWATFKHNPGRTGGTWSVNNKDVFIIKTTNGKYVKLQFVNFLNKADESGHITFKYVYQPDGSMKFE